MVKIKQGNILNCNEDIIVHQVNVQAVMGGGLAKQIASLYPNTERDYKNYCNYYNNDYNKLKGHGYLTGEENHTIYNLFSQKPNFDTDYDAMKIGLTKLKEHCKKFERSIAIPYRNRLWNSQWRLVKSI